MVREDVIPVTGTQQLADEDMMQRVAACIAPTIEEVADWHFVDKALADDWDRPLIRVLRFFTEPTASSAELVVTPTNPGPSESVEEYDELDLLTAEILDLTPALTSAGFVDEELAS